jgi:hypothetical protein
MCVGAYTIMRRAKEYKYESWKSRSHLYTTFWTVVNGYQLILGT